MGAQKARQLRTVLWRNRLMVQRNKCARCCMFTGPLFFFFLGITILHKTWGGKTNNIKTMENYVVTASQSADDGSQPFISERSGLKTNQDFELDFY